MADTYDYAQQILEAANIIASVTGQQDTNKTNKEIAEATNQANRELAEYQAQFSERMWQQQNEYNSPSAQMERFTAAGLNPNLIYSQGNSGNASSMPSYDRPTMQGYNYASPLSAMANGFTGVVSRFLAIRQQKLQNEMLAKQIDMQDYQRDILSYKVITQQLDNDLKHLGYDKARKYNYVLDDLLKTQVSAGKAALENTMRKGQLMDQQYDLNQQANERAWQQQGFAQQRLQLDQAKLQQSWNKLSLDERKVAMMEQLNSLKSQLTQRDIRRVESLIDRLRIENDILSVHRDFEKALGSKASNLFMRGLQVLIQAARL